MLPTRQTGSNKMYCLVRTPRGSSSPPMSGDLFFASFAAMHEFRGTYTDEDPTPRLSQTSPFADLVAFASQERSGDTPTEVPHSSPSAFLEGLASSLRGIDLCPPPLEPESSMTETSIQDSGEFNFFFCWFQGGDGG